MAFARSKLEVGIFIMPVVDYYVLVAVITGLVVDAVFVIGLWLSELLARRGILAKTDSKGGRRRFDGRRIILFAGLANLVFGGVLATQGILSLWAIPLFIGGLALIGKAATMRRLTLVKGPGLGH
jgi:uncharacterized membrane protein HdeD (DUF308 family)